MTNPQTPTPSEEKGSPKTNFLADVLANDGSTVEEQRDALLDHARSLESKLTHWQPIETAPKDETEITLLKGGVVTSGAWMKFESSIGDHKGKWITWATLGSGEPTHWQPLPNPPRA